MSDKLITLIYEKIENFHDPVSKKALNAKNDDLNVICKDGHANITININTDYKDKYNDLTTNIKNILKEIEELLSTNIVLTSEKTPGTNPTSDNKLDVNKTFKVQAKNIIAIASGKGGVGKSTFAVNFAVALKKLGHKVGLLDADIYGPSIPRMMGISGRPQANENKQLIPLESYGIRCMSIGFLIGVDTPTIWRGPMVMKALEQMFNGFSVKTFTC
jgi:ATP-binding protein involved in chromosome partitioning